MEKMKKEIEINKNIEKLTKDITETKNQLNSLIIGGDADNE